MAGALSLLVAMLKAKPVVAQCDWTTCHLDTGKERFCEEGEFQDVGEERQGRADKSSPWWMDIDSTLTLDSQVTSAQLTVEDFASLSCKV